MITVHTLTFNEQLLIQFFIDHYRSRFPGCKIVIHDNASTDDTVKIAKDNGCEVIPYNSNNTLDDGLHMNMKNTIWKNDSTNFSLVCDLDELLDISEDELKMEEAAGTTLIKATAWTMINKEDNYDFAAITTGMRDGGYDKVMLFHNKAITAINYGAGCHDCRPQGRIQYATKEYLMYHYRDIHPDLTVKKSQLTAQRLSQANRRNGWGKQCLRGEKELREDFERLRSVAIEVPKRRIF